MKIARIIEKKQEEKYLIEIKTVKEIVLKIFHKYLKVFEKKKVLMRKIQNYAINFKKERKDTSIIKNRKKVSSEVCKELVEKGIYLIIEITTDITSILCTEKE